MKTLDLATRTFPSRIADLDFSLALPRDWISHVLQQEALNFEDPTKLVPLAVVTAPHAAIVVAVAARPAYGDGTLSDWGRWLLENESASVRAMGEGRLGSLPALIAEATKASEIGTLVLRAAFAEDGARLVNLTLTAPELLADAVLQVWQAALDSFALGTPRGSTVSVYPPVSVPSRQSAGDDHADAGDSGETKPAAPTVETKQKAKQISKRERKRQRKEAQSVPPSWWLEAQALEEQGKIEEAVAHVGRECGFQGAIISQAGLWARTMRRRLDAGDREGAKQAWGKARDYAYGYAASATSGGEGAALSMERDQFLAELGPEPS